MLCPVFCEIFTEVLVLRNDGNYLYQSTYQKLGIFSKTAERTSKHTNLFIFRILIVILFANLRISLTV